MRPMSSMVLNSYSPSYVTVFSHSNTRRIVVRFGSSTKCLATIRCILGYCSVTVRLHLPNSVTILISFDDPVYELGNFINRISAHYTVISLQCLYTQSAVTSYFPSHETHLLKADLVGNTQSISDKAITHVW